jgi:hypothetical protein
LDAAACAFFSESEMVFVCALNASAQQLIQELVLNASPALMSHLLFEFYLCTHVAHSGAMTSEFAAASTAKRLASLSTLLCVGGRLSWSYYFASLLQVAQLFESHRSAMFLGRISRVGVVHHTYEPLAIVAGLWMQLSVIDCVIHRNIKLAVADIVRKLMPFIQVKASPRDSIEVALQKLISIANELAHS